MTIDWNALAIPKTTRSRPKRVEMAWDRCRKLVDQRDGGLCVVPGCAKWGHHKHHIVYRSLGGKHDTRFVYSLCWECHAQEHAKRLEITGNADKRLRFRFRPSIEAPWSRAVYATPRYPLRRAA